MAKETRAELTKAMINHGMKFFEEQNYKAFNPDPQTKLEICWAQMGDFSIMHSRPVKGEKGAELFDIHYSGKVLGMRRYAPEDWKIVSMKRGDWESAFLLT